MLPARRQVIAWMLSVLIAVLLLNPRAALAVVLDNENRLTITLQDGTQVTLFGEATSSPTAVSRNYYYLPAGLRLGARPDGTPEFLFLKYTTEGGDISGALMHFLLEWGLSPDQTKELEEKLKAKFPAAQLMGAVPVQQEGETGSFQIISATLANNKLTANVVTSGKAPLVAGGKAAAGSILSKEGAQLLAATFDKTHSITDLSIALNYTYSTLVPAARGTLVIDWSRMDQERESLITGWKQTPAGSTTTEDCFLFFCTTSTKPNYTYSYEESRQQYKYLEDKKIVTVQFDELVSDERVAKIRDAFFEYFLTTMSDPVDQAAAPAASDKEKDNSPDSKYGRQYSFNLQHFKSAVTRKVQRFDLSYRMTIKWPFQLVGNLASWYNAVQSNPKCVGSLVLNDPFWTSRDVRFVLDLDAKDVFSEAINNVQAQVRKKRQPPAHDFLDYVVIDEKYLREKGVAANLVYNRDTDTADVYEYRVQWSLRGGAKYPEDPPWEKGTWEAVTLVMPVVAHTIEVEGDPAALKDSGITRVTAQIRYWQFGNEVEANIPLSTMAGQPLVSKKIFLDRTTKGYAYRLVLNHKDEGKMALDWVPAVGDDYIYITIPPKLLVDAAVKSAAKDAATATVDKILDKFKDVLGPSH